MCITFADNNVPFKTVFLNPSARDGVAPPANFNDHFEYFMEAASASWQFTLLRETKQAACGVSYYLNLFPGTNHSNRSVNLSVERYKNKQLCDWDQL